MKKKTIAYFGEIDPDSDDFLSTQIIVDNHITTLVICTAGKKLTNQQVNVFEKYAKRIPEYKFKIDKAIAKDMKEGGPTFEYLEHHLEELDDITIENLLKNTNLQKTQIEQLLSILRLEEIVFHFNNDEYAIWNYSPGSDITNYQLAVYTNSEGDVVGLAMEN